MQALDRQLLRELVQLKGQATAVALIVACAIASFVTTRSTYESLRLTQATYYERYRFAQVFSPLKRAPQSFGTRLQSIPGVAQVQTRVVVNVTLDVPGLDEPASGRLVSIPEQRRPMLNDLFLRRGRYIARHHRDEVLVSEAFAEANGLDLGDRLGAVINGRWESLHIVGVVLSPEYIYEIQGVSSFFPDNKRFGVLWMGRKALGVAFDMDGAFNDVTLTLVPGANESIVIAELDRLLDRYGGLGAHGRYQQISHRFLSDDLDGLKVSATVVPTIFLGIAAFLLNIVLSRLVRTQRESIAILKAFGYTNLAIGWHYLKLVLTIVLLGAALGTAVGLWWGGEITAFYGQFYRFPLLRYEIRWELITATLLVSLSAAILGALTAIRSAVSLPPAEAMRPEPPARFRPTVVERMGLQSVFSPVARIILRNIERKPVQTLLSVLGIALAIAILILGRYFADAIEYMIEVQFRHVQREDVSLVFHQPRPSRARYDIRNLPGVIHAEPFRTVPARLRFAHRTHRSGLIGLKPDGELRRLVDRHLQTHPLPSDGIVLTTKLAEILGLTPGQMLTVEVLEGVRPVRQIPVAGVIDELIGVSAYMDIRALNRLMREGRTISGAYLTVDPQRVGQLYTLLKRTPAVAGVSLRQAALMGFEDTVGASLGVFTSVLTVFACIITFGVVYNAARISLSERERELASLRVIGFTRAEVAVILLGEQAILTLVAIPCGLVLGYGFAALMPLAYHSELYRIPFVVTGATYVFACIVIIAAALLSGFTVRQRLAHLDLIAVLKTRE
jgi:putative ABC transport system permease protein